MQTSWMAEVEERYNARPLNIGTQTEAMLQGVDGKRLRYQDLVIGELTKSSKRFLDSPELRATLYYSSGGRCQSCGVALEEGWHADHVIPWSVTHRTNVFEMQALCPPCNLKKGSSMNDRPEFEIYEDAFRIGQRRAYQTIVRRIREREQYTAIVLPTRYGKTDVMRIAGLRLWRDRLVSRTMIMAPDKILRDQCVRGDKIKEAITRYRIPHVFPGGLSTYKVDRPPSPSRLTREDPIFVAITTQMATRHKAILSQWVAHEMSALGVPPVIFVDEAHTGSDQNDWGDTVKVLADAGAFVVLMTATPYRADGRQIPGFEIIPERTRPVTVPKRVVDQSGDERIDIYEGQRHYYRLKAHHITTFRQAWDEENPSPLCKVSRRTFEISLSEVDALTGEYSPGFKLSHLNEQNTRRALMPALKDVKIVRDACRILVAEMDNRRLDAEGTAAIVFVGNDAQYDPDANQHARHVQGALRELAPHLKSVIATSSDPDDAAETIDLFISGQADVLIVKQMAGRGLDIDRLKVCLDLSNIRTPAAFVQRMTRICTVWDRTGNPDDVIGTATYIAPDDCLQAGLFKKFVTDEGGEATTTDLRYVRTVLPEERERKQAPIYIPDSVELPEEMEDTQQEKAPGEMIPVVDKFFNALPELQRTRTKPGLANILNDVGINVADDPGPPVRDINRENGEMLQRINQVSKKLINLEVRKKMGRPYRPGDKESRIVYPRAATEVWNRHKRRVNIPLNRDVKDIEDIATLKAIHRNMARELQNG